MTRIIAARSTQAISESWDRSLIDEPVLLHEFFEQAAQRYPDRIAIDTPPSSVRAERRTITYAELDRQVNALAGFLRAFVKEECVVAILLPRDSEHLYLAQLAVLKAGAAYTCIDPAFPDEQINNILTDSKAVAVLADAAGAGRARRIQPDIECNLNVIAWIDALDCDVEPLEPASWLSPSSLAYIIYTSGTTGRPKGVMIEHGSIANLVQGDLTQLGIRPEDRCGQSASSAYDSSVEETWFALAAGATLVVMDDETTRLGPDLIAWLREERVTLFAPSPTLLRATGCENPEKELPGLRVIHVGGEALPTDVAERWAKGRRLINDYGPTETTVTAMRGRILPGEKVTIGRPVPGMKAWVLNDRLEEVADGEQGELCLGGVALARGYMNDAGMTANKFPVHNRLGRIYRTGDLVHRANDGKFYCHGRIDAQVKIRGYRIELEAIEARLVECAGVREAACRVQGEGAQAKIVAFIVPEDLEAPPSFEDLKTALTKALPIYMVPSFFGILDKLPISVSGKLNRKALPTLEVHVHEIDGQVVAPRNATEEKLAGTFQVVLRMTEPVSVEDDFFCDLGGDSLLAAQLISKLRDDPATASLTVRDLYEARTVAALAKRIPQQIAAVATPKTTTPRPMGRPVLATLVQTAWILLGYVIAAPVLYALTFKLLPFLADSFSPLELALYVPLLLGSGFVAYAVGTVALAVAMKKLLIGTYEPMSAPVWGSFYVRNWIVTHVMHLIPWQFLEGTIFQLAILRLLGAKIGKNVHIHRHVNFGLGGWDLLEIGDDVTLSQDATIGLVELEHGQIIVGPVKLGAGCTLDVRAGVASTTAMGPNSYLTPLSFLTRGGSIPAGERWDGIPAKPKDQTPPKPELSPGQGELSPFMHGLMMTLARGAVTAFASLPTFLLTIALAVFAEVDAESATSWLLDSSFELTGFLLATALVLAHVPLTIIFSAIAMRLMGRATPGVVSRWSFAYIRVWLKTSIVESVNGWLLGSLLWPVWLRCAGMKIGRGCEMSTIIDTVPELVEIGAGSFFADGIYLAGPRIHQGTVTLAITRFGEGTFLGNNVVIPIGQNLPAGVLLGVSTVADDMQMKPDTSWFGQPPFELPNREVVAVDARYGRVPMWLRYVNRVTWELLRFTLPLAPLLMVVLWFKMLALAEANVSWPTLLFAVVPALDIAFIAAMILMGLVLKWVLLGRVKPGVHPLFSSWCSRWEFHYIAWDLFTAGPLNALEGTLLMNWFLRAMGMKIGKNVVLGHGFAFQIDHDMLEFEDGATICCMFQAHTFEDRVLKIDRVKIRAEATIGQAAVILYGADIGEQTNVTPHSVVMKHEKLLPALQYAGAPTHVL